MPLKDLSPCSANITHKCLRIKYVIIYQLWNFFKVNTSMSFTILSSDSKNKVRQFPTEAEYVFM